MTAMASMALITTCALAGRGGANQTMRETNQTTCSKTGESFPDCLVMDEAISWQHRLAPWLLAFGTVLVLGLPTMLLQYKHREDGLKSITASLVQCVALMLVSHRLDHPSIQYTLGLHSSAHVLLSCRTQHLLGGSHLGNACFLACILLVFGAGHLGPPVSVVNWSGHDQVSCALLAHLLGCLVPPLVHSCLAHVHSGLSLFFIERSLI